MTRSLCQVRHNRPRWERTAPPDGHLGALDDGRPQRNTQTARMGRLLTIMGNTQDVMFRKLEKRTQRKDGRSYVSRDRSWMREPYELPRGWYFEGCMSLADKQALLHNLPTLGVSSLEFAKCAQDFVAGRSVEKYLPEDDEAARLLEQWKKRFASEEEQAGQ